MTEEKRKILNRIDELIDKRKTEMLKSLPSIHEIDDGIIIRFFTDWDDCVNNIKYKRIVNMNNSDDIVIFYFVPKGAVVQLAKRDYIRCLACLSGRFELKFSGKTHILTGFNKICLDTNEFEGIALDDTYILTSSKS
jgi:hypothetical protein